MRRTTSSGSSSQRSKLETISASFLKRLGATIRSIRKSQGLHQHQLGEKIGLPGSRISEIERSVVRTSTVRIQMIAEGLGMSIASLLKKVDMDGGEEISRQVRSRIMEKVKMLDLADLEIVDLMISRLVRP